MNSVINLLQLFLRLLVTSAQCTTLSLPLLFHSVAVQGGKGNILKWRDACRGRQGKSGCNSGKQWKLETT